MLVKFKLKSWPKNNQNIKDIGVTLTKEKQQVNTLTFGPEPPRANAGIDQEMAYEKSVFVDGSESYNPNNCLLYTSPSPRDGLLSRMPSSA